MNYSNLPVYIGVQSDDPSAAPPSNYLPAQNISVDYQAENTPLRLLGDDIDVNNQFTHGAALQAKISFNSYINTETSGALQTILGSSGDNVYKIRFGNNMYSGCYLSDYSIAVEPFKPAVLSANYVVYNAPQENLNTDTTITIVNVPGSTNNLLYSESLNNTDYYKYTNCFTGGSILDPTGETKAISISGQGNNVINYNYTVSSNNYDTTTWAANYTGVTGYSGFANLTALKTNNDLSTGISFTGGKNFPMASGNYSKIWISNNGIFSFNSDDVGYANYENKDFPIVDSTREFIAAYWRDNYASVGNIRYVQLTDRFIIEYDGIYSVATGAAQYYQVHFIFATGVIEIRYDNVPDSNVFNPNANIGIQWENATDKYINTLLSLIIPSKTILKYTPNNVSTGTPANFVYNTTISPKKLRTFSIYLKRFVGSGAIKHTTDGGTTYNTVSPALTTGWQRYAFPATNESQKIGIQIETLGDVIYAYGAQLEDYSFSTPYIPTTGSTVTRAVSTQQVSVDTIYPTTQLTTGFADKMINGHNCSVSSTTGIVSAIQSSIRYNVSCARSPVYDIGSINPTDIILDSVEKQMDISSTNLKSFIDFSGSKLNSNLQLTLKDAQNIIGSVISMNSGANVYSQKSAIQENETLTTEVSIREIVI
jgi:hypothetical protein